MQGKLSALTRNEVGRLPVDMVLTMAPGEPATLAVTDGTHRVEVAGEVPQTALTRPTDEELARRALEILGEKWPQLVRQAAEQCDQSIQGEENV